MKDWKTWVLLLGIYLLVKMCGGCEGCSGCSNNSKIKCHRCGEIKEPVTDGGNICKDCSDQISTKRFNEEWEKREKAIPVRVY